jgi:hypothetical protein
LNPKDEKNLYIAIGFIMVSWGFIESSSAMATNALYLNAKLQNKPGHMPKFLKEQFKFMRRCLYDIPEFKLLKQDALAIIAATEKEKDMRELFAHSALTSTEAPSGIYTFTNLDAKDDHHLTTDWEFDANTFPVVVSTLRNLAEAWHQLSDQIVRISEAL